jgi:hypothetical protein
MILNNFDNSGRDFDVVGLQRDISTSEVLTEEIIPLLEERLMVNFTQRKIGEFVVRKEIETHTIQVQVPVRREKLIVEQVSPEYKRIAEVDLGQENISDEAIAAVLQESPLFIDGAAKFISARFVQDTKPTICGRVASVEDAKNLIDKIASVSSDDIEAIQIEIILRNLERQDIYQVLLEHNCQD